MFQKGNPGRQKGTKNKSTISVEETAKRLGVDPFEVLCLFVKGDKKALGLKGKAEISASFRLAAAQTACRYLYSQKRSVEITNPDGTGFRVSIVDYSTKKEEK